MYHLVYLTSHATDSVCINASIDISFVALCAVCLTKNFRSSLFAPTRSYAPFKMDMNDEDEESSKASKASKPTPQVRCEAKS